MEIAESYKKLLFRLATPEASGSGFYIKDYDLLITSEHIIRGHRYIIVDNEFVQKQLAQVIYKDQLLDIAFLKTNQPLDLPHCNIQEKVDLNTSVVSMAYPFRAGLCIKEGTISSLSTIRHGISHIVHDAVLDNSANGSPLFDQKGNVLGINNFVSTKSGTQGYTLPSSKIIESINSFLECNASIASRCTNCKRIVGGEKIDNCPHCGQSIEMPDNVEEFQSTGVCKTIEDLLLSMGYALDLARIGPEHWELERGSALVDITYYHKNGLIIGDAYMCKIPPHPNGPLFEYLLRLNHELENLTFSVRQDDIILSLLIYDRYLTEETGTRLLSKLLKTADHYDNILVKDYGCLWTSSRSLI